MTPVPAIRPISDLRTDLNSVCEMAQELQQPIFMTKNGKPSLVVMDSEAYERQRLHDHYVAKLREAEIVAAYDSKRYTMDEVNAQLDEIIATAEELADAHA